VLASHTARGKDDKPIHSQVVLSISNWHFNRDRQYLKFGPRCRLEDVCISLKLSSTAFIAGDTVGPSFSGSTTEDEALAAADDVSTATSTTDDSCFNFDKNGVIIPYFAFVSLMDDEGFHHYLKKVVEKFEESEGPIKNMFPSEDEDDDADDDDDDNSKNLLDEDDVEVIVKKKKKRGGRQPIEYVDDNNDDAAADTEVTALEKKRRPNTPMDDNLDFGDTSLPPILAPQSSFYAVTKRGAVNGGRKGGVGSKK